ncbi:PIN domain-containing protein [bacterium]|nr:PIN domain-containing protein [bacterium]MCI0602105.1 PIN domain-containing protein [bacterium]
MIAIDTNLLVYAHREDSQWHAAASSVIKALAEGPSIWTIPWPCIHEFLAIVTHSKIYSPPTPLSRALAQVDAWMESPSLVLLSESEGYWKEFRSAMLAGRISGPQVHDARVAALCRFHGIDELWTADRDFGRFTGILVKNPLIS